MNTSTGSIRIVARALVVLAAATLAGAVGPGALNAQQHTHEEEHEHAEGHGHAEDGHHAGLHFTHPLIAESVSPDTKIRVDHQFFEFPDGDSEHSGVLEAEYAVTRGFSVEAGIPYSYSAGTAGNAELKLKFANYAFEEAGVLLGYGLEFGFPTNGEPGEGDEPPASPEASAVPGSDRSHVGFPGPRFSGGGAGVAGTLGTDEWEVAPFLNVGFKRGPVELVGWGIFGIPFDQAEQEEVATEISWNLSGLYHVSRRVQALVELDGSGGISGEAVGEDVVNLSPGLRVQLLPDRPLVLGSSVGFPLAAGVEEDPFDVRWKTSLFWHF